MSSPVLVTGIIFHILSDVLQRWNLSMVLKFRLLLDSIVSLHHFLKGFPLFYRTNIHDPRRGLSQEVQLSYQN